MADINKERLLDNIHGMTQEFTVQDGAIVANNRAEKDFIVNELRKRYKTVHIRPFTISGVDKYRIQFKDTKKNVKGIDANESLDDESLYEDKEQYESDFNSLITNGGVNRNSVAQKMEIELYEKDGKCPVKEFLLSLSDDKLREKTTKNIYELSELGVNAPPPLSRSIKDGIFELRSKQGSNIDRIFYFFVFGNKIIMTNGYVKESEKMDSSEFARAKRYMNEYLGRNNK